MLIIWFWYIYICIIYVYYIWINIYIYCPKCKYQQSEKSWPYTVIPFETRCIDQPLTDHRLSVHLATLTTQHHQLQPLSLRSPKSIHSTCLPCFYRKIQQTKDGTITREITRKVSWNTNMNLSTSISEIEMTRRTNQKFTKIGQISVRTPLNILEHSQNIIPLHRFSAKIETAFARRPDLQAVRNIAGWKGVSQGGKLYTLPTVNKLPAHLMSNIMLVIILNISPII